jgi:serine/threonine-protein kinase
MSDYLPKGKDSAPARLERQDQVCDRFETAWKAGRRPRLERYLDKVSPAEQRELLRELLALELVYRSQSGEQLDPEEYRRRFPPTAS